MRYLLNNDFIYNDLEEKDELMLVNLNDDSDETIYKLRGVAREMFLGILDNLSESQLFERILATYEINDKKTVLKNIQTLVFDLSEAKILVTE